jgi:hypothetical protein
MICGGSIVSPDSQALFVLHPAIVALEAEVDPDTNIAFPVGCVDIKYPLVCCVRPLDRFFSFLDGSLKARVLGCLIVGFNYFKVY